MPATTATAIPEASENRRSDRCPTAKEHCSMAQQAAAKASTATEVWMRSCQVKLGP